MSVQIIGFCRFSFFGPSDTKIKFDDPKAAFDALYAPDRMAARFDLFENLFLPSIAAQRDPDFRLIVISSAVMPAEYRDRLTALCAPIPQIEVVFADSQDLRAVVAPYIQDPALKGQSLIQFRIDDDDALSARYVARLRDWAGYLRDQMIICFPLGIMLYSDAEGAKCDLMMRNLTAVGFAFHTKGPTDRTPLMFSHVQAGRRYPYVVDTSIAAYIQTFTASSDTATRIARKLPEFRRKAALRTPARTAEALPNKLRKHFPTLNMDDLLALQTRVQGNLQRKIPKEATQ